MIDLTPLSLGGVQLGNLVGEISDEHAYPALERLRSEGLVGAIGAGMKRSEMLGRFARDTDMVGRAIRIAEVCERYAVALPAAALAFPLAHPAVSSICVGAHSPEQLERNAGLMRQTVPAELWAELKAEGLVPEDAPV